MRYAVLGTGVVGRTIAGKRVSLGHEVVIGAHDPQVARTEPDGYGNPSVGWAGVEGGGCGAGAAG